MKMDTQDEMLAGAARMGDAEAFAALVSRHYDRIYRLGWRLLGTREAAEDLAQDICAALPAKLQSFRAEARFSTWLYTVTLNAARDRLRRRGTRMRAADGWGETERLRRAELAENRAQMDWLHAAMSGLSAELRETVALVLGEELTQAEAAAALGVAQGTVGWRMSEVKRLLRDQAKEEGHI